MKIARSLKTAFLWNTCSVDFSESLYANECQMFEGLYFTTVKLGHVAERTLR